MNFNFELYDVQDDYVWCQKPFVLFEGGIGTGKSTALCVRSLVKATARPTFGMITAPTYSQLRDATIRTFFEICPPELIVHYNKADFEVRLRADGGFTDIAFRSTHIPDNLRGPNLGFVAMDEINSSSEEAFDVLIGRLRHGEDVTLFGAGTPKGRNWTYRLWHEEASDDYAFFHARTRDNPFLSDIFLRAVYKKYRGNFAKQELEGEYVDYEGLVYPLFSRKLHVGHYEVNENRPIDLAIDFGYINPYAVLFLQQDSFGRVYVVDEIYGSHLTDEIVVEQIKAKPYFDQIRDAVADNAEPDRIKRLRDLGIPCRAAEKGTISSGIEKVRALLPKDDYLQSPLLLVDEKCENIIYEFGQYRYADAKENRNPNEIPMDKDNHALGALRYWVNTKYRPRLAAIPSASQNSEKRVGFTRKRTAYSWMRG